MTAVGIELEGSGQWSTVNECVLYRYVEPTAIRCVVIDKVKKPVGEICQYPAAMPFFLESLAAYDLTR